MCEYEMRLQAVYWRQIKHSYERLTHLEERLTGLSPVKVLERGFAIVRLNGSVVRRACDLAPEDQIGVEFSQGSAKAVVKELT
jgi:exonuclease VII large subunit